MWAADVYNEDLDTQRAASTVMTHGSTCSGPGMANLVYSLGPEAQLLCSTLHAMRGPKGSDRAIPRPRPHRKPQHNLKIYSLHSQRENTDKRQAAHAHAGKVQDKRDVNSIPSDFCKENPPANGNLIAGECSPKKPVTIPPNIHNIICTATRWASIP